MNKGNQKIVSESFKDQYEGLLYRYCWDFFITEDILKFCDIYNCFWCINTIVFMQTNRALKDVKFQEWCIKVTGENNGDKVVMFTCKDKEGKHLYNLLVESSNYPFIVIEVKIRVIEDVITLPKED